MYSIHLYSVLQVSVQTRPSQLTLVSVVNTKQQTATEPTHHGQLCFETFLK